MDWFRLYAEFATDPKVQMMSEALQRRLLILFCLQCSNGIETFHETERETAIAFALRISETELAETKDVFLRRGFIHEDWTLANWDKRQYVSDSSTERVRKHREAKKHAKETSETLPKRSGNAPEQIQNRTDTEQKKNNQPAARAASLSVADLVDKHVDEQVAKEFLAIRRKKRAPLTPLALEGICREAGRAGMTLGDALRRCVERGWQGFEASWVAQARGSPGMNRQEALEARNQAVVEDLMRTAI